MIKRKQFKDLLYVKQGKEYLQCSKCGEIKELTEENYYKKNGGKNWILICKDCKKKRYEDKKAEIKVYSKKYREENKEYYKEYAKNYNNGKETTNIKVKDFKQESLPIINKLINSDGEVTTSDGRKFTRLVGGFGEGKPIITVKQVSELLEQELRVVNQTINRNIKEFETGVDIVDLKKKSITAGDSVDYSLLNMNKQSVSNSKNIYILSQSGFLLYLRYAKGEKATSIYKSFIEDYFKTKVELVVAENTIQENINTLLDTKKMLLGSALMEQDEAKRYEIMLQLEEINNQILVNEKTLAKEETIEQFKEVVEIADRFTSDKKLYDIGVFSKILDIPRLGKINMFRWLRDSKILNDKNIPYQRYSEYFKVINVTKNDREFTKTMLKGNGVKFVVKQLIKDGYIDNLSPDEVYAKLEVMKGELIE